jgi:hypothetical protein
MMTTKNCFRIDGAYAGRDNLGYGIKKGDKVLDIGGGARSFIHATHILDSTNTEFEAQRYNNQIELESGQILIDGTTDDLMQFKDNEFDFIYTSHTLEHVIDLPHVLEEISRVGKRGFVAVPHYLYDFWSVDLSSGHKWFCDYSRGFFLIRERLPNDFVPYASREWENIMRGEGWDKPGIWRTLWDGSFCVGIRPFWEIRFFWYDCIDYKVDDTMFYQLDLFREMVAQANKQGENKIRISFDEDK